VIDGKTAFTGGINFADEYINKRERFGHWKDCAIRLQGEAVKSFTLMFLQMWNIAGGKENYAYYLSKSVYNPLESYDGYLIPYGDSPLDNEKVGETVYMDIINTATEYVHIMTPYLIIDNEITTALTNAAKRGVDVKIIVPHIPDHKSAYAIAKTHYSELVPEGVKIYEYTPGFIHSKVFVSDSTKAVVGTINLDYRSLYLHFECAAYLYGASAIADIEDDFDNTLKKCQQIDKSDIRNIGFITHLKNGLLKLIAPLM
jgi:cardiolipin synthase